MVLGVWESIQTYPMFLREVLDQKSDRGPHWLQQHRWDKADALDGSRTPATETQVTVIVNEVNPIRWPQRSRTTERDHFGSFTPDATMCTLILPKYLAHSGLTGWGKPDWPGFSLSPPGSDWIEVPACRQRGAQESKYFIAENERTSQFCIPAFLPVKCVDNTRAEGMGWEACRLLQDEEPAKPDLFQKLGLSSKGFDLPTSGWPAPSSQTHQTDE